MKYQIGDRVLFYGPISWNTGLTRNLRHGLISEICVPTDHEDLVYYKIGEINDSVIQYIWTVEEKHVVGKSNPLFEILHE